jgi:hypothetical protein
MWQVLEESSHDLKPLGRMLRDVLNALTDFLGDVMVSGMLLHLVGSPLRCLKQFLYDAVCGG